MSFFHNAISKEQFYEISQCDRTGKKEEEKTKQKVNPNQSNGGGKTMGNNLAMEKAKEQTRPPHDKPQ